MDQNNDNLPSLVELEEALLSSLDEAPSKIDKQELPTTLFAFPILRRPFFPGMAAPLVIEPGPYYEALKLAAKTEHKCLALFLTRSETCDIHNLQFEDLYPVGVLARILRIIPVEHGGVQVILNMEKRVQALRRLPQSKYFKVKVSFFKERQNFNQELKAYAISIIATIKELLKYNPLFKEELQIFLGHSDFAQPGKLADFAVALTTASREELQLILETIDIRKRIDRSLILLKKELDLSQLQHSINVKLEAAVTKTQKDFYLREQLKTIKRELGIEKDDKNLDREKFEARIKERKIPPEVLKVIQDEMEKLSVLEMQSAEYAVVRGYLDWLTIIPWGMISSECRDIFQAEKILNKDHYGLEDIKERILEFISVGQLTNGVKGNIICLLGPPGVGKTSIGKSIARALNRPFYRFSVGGMHDEAEIKGHRRTYVGAMPGKIIQALKSSQAMNPVIMLDEIDKIGNSYRGDPASALLEVLDPEQNTNFLDHYLDVRCDLSHVLFIVTANVLDSIPEPLKDRMDILRLSGYIQQEKILIARQYLIPRHRKQMGLKATQVRFKTAALKAIINGYAREAGVRSLEQNIKKILRKVAREIVRSLAQGKAVKHLPYIIDESNLTHYLGKPQFTTDRFYERTPVGVSTGLAWTSLGGATLYVEAIKVASDKTEMKLTGQVGAVMKESAEIAWSYLQSALHRYAPTYTFFKKMRVHLHIPEGATPKDGPSAGITLVTALLSLLTNTPVRDNLGMTGELTLTGRILAIGGVKEKVIAARRSGLNWILLPEANRKDWDELPDHIKEGLRIDFVDHYDQVFEIAFETSLKI